MTQQASGWVPDPSSDFGARLALTGQTPGGEWLPRRDSNLEPSDYRTTDDGINVWGWAA